MRQLYICGTDALRFFRLKSPDMLQMSLVSDESSVTLQECCFVRLAFAHTMA